MVQPVGEVPEHLSRDMACTPDDLRRWMPAAVAHRAIAWTDAGCTVALGEGRQVTLRWTPLPPRRIALLRMERLRLEIDFVGCSADERRDFIERFDAYTRRGGG